MNRKYVTTLTVLTIVTGVTLTNPVLPLLAMLTVIGIPVAIFMMAAPTLLIFLSLSGVVYWATGQRKISLVIGCVVALVVMAIPPLLIDARLDAQRTALILHDHNDLNPPIKHQVIAIRANFVSSASNTRVPTCEDFCLRALLTGLSAQVIELQTDIVPEEINPLRLAPSFRMERRKNCPSMPLENEAGQIDIEAEHYMVAANGKTFVTPSKYNAVSLMKDQIAQGNCLISEQAELGIADFVISTGLFKKGLDDYDAGLDLFADTVSAYRKAVHIRTSKGYEEMFRSTSVVVQKLFWPLVPTANFRGISMAKSGFLRTDSLRDIEQRKIGYIDWSTFVTKTLGFKLTLNDVLKVNQSQ